MDAVVLAGHVVPSQLLAGVLLVLDKEDAVKIQQRVGKGDAAPHLAAVEIERQPSGRIGQGCLATAAAQFNERPGLC